MHPLRMLVTVRPGTSGTVYSVDRAFQVSLRQEAVCEDPSTVQQPLTASEARRC